MGLRFSTSRFAHTSSHSDSVRIVTTYDSHRYASINRWDPSHLKRIDRLISMQPGDRVLEVGCGQGHLTRALADRGIDIVGIDANPQAAEVAGNGIVRHMAAEALAFEDATFDFLDEITFFAESPNQPKFPSVVLRPASRMLEPPRPNDGTNVRSKLAPRLARSRSCPRATRTSRNG